MIKRKLGINSDCIIGANPVETLKIIKDTGFESFFTLAFEEKEIGAQQEIAQKLGLYFEFIHAPFHDINTLWAEGESYHIIYDEIIQAIDSAAKFGVKTIILHIASGRHYPYINALGLSRFDAIIAHAKEKGVCVAIENLRFISNLAYFMERYEDQTHVGFCYDIGHELCRTIKPVPYLDIYGHKLLCTHLHDNDGFIGYDENGDLHLLPFDGKVDFQKAKKKLDELGFENSLMLEVFNHRQYEGMKAEEFIPTAFERVTRISKL